jgi:hypothetical protein
VIDRLLGELADALRADGVEGAAARRVLTEARDHLDEAAALVGDEDAVRGFGSPQEFAALVAAELATTATRVAAVAAFSVLSLAGLAYAVLFLTLPLAGRPDMFGGRVPGLGVAIFAGVVFAPQVAFVSGCLALIRVARLRRRGALGDAELRVQRRRTGVALAGGFVTFAALGLAALDFRSDLAGWWVTGSLAASVTFAIGFTVVAAMTIRSSRPRAGAQGSAEDVFDDLAPLLHLPVLRRLELPAHPWRFAALVALGAAFPVVVGGIGGGDPFDGLIRAATEVVAVLGCYAVFGRPLGLRRI